MLSLPLRSPVFRGTFAGLLATIPMTMILERMQRFLPTQERYALPPVGELANIVAEKVGLGPFKNTPPHQALTGVTQVGYGTATGAVYAAIEPRLPYPAWLTGMAYGFLVWVGNYLGWLPAFGILQPATRPARHQTPRRQMAVMIVAHLIWGAITGILVRSLNRRKFSL